jgi:hypothetical protein
MGIGLALASWCFKGTAIATAVAVLVGVVTAIRVPRGRPGRTRLILWTCVYPFAVFAWFMGVFVFQAYVNEALLYRDPWIGHTHQTTLPNGYAVLLIDEDHDGTVFNPATHFTGGSSDDINPDGPDAVSGVRVLQIAGKKILGGAGPLGQYSSQATRDRIDYFFILDTEAHTRANFETYDAITQAVKQFNIQPQLQPILGIYERYRFTWFDLSAIALFLVPVLGAAFVIIRRIRRLAEPIPPAIDPRELRSAT